MISKLHKAVVRWQGIWRFVLGEPKGYDFVFILNGRMETARDGDWQEYRDADDAIIESEVCQLNIYTLKTRPRQ